MIFEPEADEDSDVESARPVNFLPGLSRTLWFPGVLSTFKNGDSNAP
jgi:hypothetical protein